MKICILARQRNNFSNRRLRDEAKKLGHKLLIVDPNDFELVLRRQRPALYRNGRPFDNVDVVSPRLGASITNYGLAVVGQFEMMGVRVVNDSHAILRTRDKLRCIQMMSLHGIGMPRTVMIRKPADIAASVDRVGGFPVVLKLLSGTQGVGVMLAETMHSIESTLATLWSLGQDILLQECIREALGRDVRVVVIGGEVVAAMGRQARIGEFRANLHRGGVGVKIRLPIEYEDTAREAARIVGLEIAGVDLLESDDGPKVIEINSSPGLEGIEATTGVNVAREMLRYLGRSVKQAKGKRAQIG